MSNIYGGQGDDSLFGDAQDDKIYGDNGGDTLDGGDGRDALSGGYGNDSLSGDAGDDVLDGGADDDYVNGDDGDDQLFGGVGNDTLYGGAGNDTLNGGRGNDSLSGGEGSDTYRFGIGSGRDSIYNYDYDASTDRILLGSGITTTGVTLLRSGDDLIIKINGTDDQLTVQTYFYNDATDAYAVNTIEFANGTVWDINTVKAAVLLGTPEVDTLYGYAGNETLNGGSGSDTLYGNAGNDTLNGDGGNDTIYGGNNNDTLNGGAGDDGLNGDDGDDALNGGLGNDSLYGGNGNDTLDGGSGNDSLSGGEGSDTYRFGIGSGRDSIYNYDYDASTDRILLGSGIATTGVTLLRSGDDLIIKINGTDDQLTVQYYFYNDASDPYTVNTIEFASGTVWDINFVKANATNLSTTGNTLNGTASGETLNGGNGYDSLIGDAGNDTLNGGAGNDSLSGGDDNDTLNGGLGDDSLNGDGGNDILDGGSGNDTLSDSYGANTYKFGRGSGQDTVYNYHYDSYYDEVLGDYVYPETPDRILLGASIVTTDITLSRFGDSLIIKINGTEDQLTISSYFYNDAVDGYEVANIEFADGTLWNVATVKAAVLQGTAEADSLSGYATADTINGGSGNDSIVGNAGLDTLNGDNGNDHLSGNAGNDTLNGGAGNDSLYGGDDNDTLNGGLGDDSLNGDGGNDILDGGSGNDTLSDSYGANTYKFGRGSGQDTVYNYHSDSYYDEVLGDYVYPETPDRILLGASIVTTDITLSRFGDSLIIKINGTEDQLTIGSYFYNDAADGYEVANIEFADGTLWNVATVKVAVLQGTSEEDSLSGYATADTINGGSGNDSIVGNAGLDTLNGDNGNDQLSGNAGNDTLNGGAGNDSLYGGDDNDILNGGLGDDSLNGEGGNDTLDGGSGNDTLSDSYGANTYKFGRGSGQDTVYNYHSDSYYDEVLGDYVYPETPDRILLGAGITTADITLLQDGDNLVIIINDLYDRLTVESHFYSTYYQIDTIEFADGTIWDTSTISTIVSTNSNAGLTLIGDATANTFNGGVGHDYIDGQDNNDVLNGGAGSDFIVGGAGNDVINGGADVDTMIGGLGNDTYYVDDIWDTVVDHLGEGTDTVVSSVNYTLGANAENLTLIGGANLSGIGNDLNNVLTGNIGNNLLIGLGGNDTLNGGVGADTMQGGVGDDSYFVDNIADIVVEADGAGNDKVYSSVTYSVATQFVEQLQLTGTANINATGNGLNNILIGNSGNNILNGAAGVDNMQGGVGDDSYFVDNIADIVVEASSAGNDKVYSSVTYSVATQFVEQLLLTGTANINATGNGLNNILIGNSGNNTLNGAAGVDTMQGSLGDDIYFVDNVGDSTVEAADAGNDKVFSSVTYSVATQFIEQLQLTGTANINATGNGLNNILIGNSGNNTLNGAAGVDNMQGGLGDDIYFVDNVGDSTVEAADAGNDKVFSSVTYSVASQFIEQLELTGTANINATGNGLNNILIGNSGNNTLNGSVGADTMQGGLGDDVYYVDNVGDLTIEASGAGTDKVFSSISYGVGSQFIEQVWLTGATNINATGNGLNNILIGNSGNNTLNGGAGVDNLQGGLGDDIYYVDNVGDVVVEANAAGTDKVFSTVTYSVASQFVEQLWLTGSDNINATGNSLNNVIIGNSGNNVITGGAGVDNMQGGLGNDSYFVDSASDVILEAGGAGIDTIYSTVSFVASVNVENLVLTGAANLNATGNTLANLLKGNTGNNLLDGQAGNDTLVGVSGADTAMYQLLTGADARGGNGSDSWTDFTVGNTAINTNADKIDIGDLLIGYGGGGTLAALDPYLTVNISGSNTTVLIDRDGAGGTYTDTLLLTLNGVNTSLLTLINNNQILI